MSMCHSLASIVIAIAWISFATGVARGQAGIDPARRLLDQEFAQKLSSLADQCHQLDLPEQEKITRNWFFPRDPSRQYYVLIPREGTARPAEGASAGVLKWHDSFRQARQDHAERLFELSKEALGQGQAVGAYQLLFDVLREDPDHAPARRILGYQKDGQTWYTGFAARQSRVGKVLHPKFGWLQAEHVIRYDSGQRLFKGRWVSAADEDRFRGRIESGWRVETDHYVVKTNHSLQAGVALGSKLEELYSVWRRMFVKYYSSDHILARRLRGETVALGPARKYQVVFFRNRGEYVAQLKREQPLIDITLGIYLGKQRKAYFFAGSEQEDATLFHEATHQLFYETTPAGRRTRDDIGSDHNFWIIEGVALYMASLVRHDGYYSVGGLDAARLQAARHHVVSGDFFLPLVELVALGRQQFQTHEQIRPVYSQSAGLAQFLMDGRRGRYRDALVDYIKTVYARRDQMDTLSRLAGSSYAQLDAQYREYLGVGN